MAKKKAAEETIPAAETVTTPPSPTISKVEAVRETIREGIGSPKEASKYISEKYGLDVPPGMVSSYKTKEKAGNGTPAKKPGRKARKTEGGIDPVGVSAPTAGPRVGNGSAAELAKAVKGLVDQYGATEVSGMVAVFGG